MTDLKQHVNQDCLSSEIKITVLDGVNYISAESLASALNVPVLAVKHALLSHAKSCGSDAAIISVTTVNGGVLLCNARGFVGIAHEFLTHAFAQPRQAAVLNALLKDSAAVDGCLKDRAGLMTAAQVFQVLELRLALNESWLTEAQAKLALANVHFSRFDRSGTGLEVVS